MSDSSKVYRAYQIGKALAKSDHQEKTAFLGGIAQAGKFMAGMGHLGAKGSSLAKLSPHWVGSPLGFGALGAATADEGERMQGFAKGFVGGLAFNAAMPLGGAIGKRIFAPGFSGKGSSRIMKGIGFSDDAVGQMSASQALNRPIHGSLGRQLDAGTASRSHLNKLREAFKNSTRSSKVTLNPELKAQRTQLAKMFRQGKITPTQQAELKRLYSQYSANLYKAGYGTGTAGQRAALKGIRISKGVGIMGGGMGLGMAVAHPIEGMMDAHPASVFDASGGH
jgi:hypothetical protein